MKWWQSQWSARKSITITIWYNGKHVVRDQLVSATTEQWVRTRLGNWHVKVHESALLLFFWSSYQNQAHWKRKSTTFHGPSRPIFRVWLFQNLSYSISPAAAERAVSSWSSVHCQTAKLPKSNYACAPAHARARAPAALSACTALARPHPLSLANFRLVLSWYTLFNNRLGTNFDT